LKLDVIPLLASAHLLLERKVETPREQKIALTFSWLPFRGFGLNEIVDISDEKRQRRGTATPLSGT
jgi:hypothetical protein